MIKGQEEGRRLPINKGMELMLQRKNKKKEESYFFSFIYAKMVSLFDKEFHFRIEFNIRKRNL